MRMLSLFLIIAVAPLPALGAKQNVTGQWEFTSSSPLGERTQVVEMKQNGKTLSVSMTTREGDSVTGKGTVKDGTISWTLSFDGERGAITITYSGRLEEGQLKGKVKYGNFASGRWTASKATAE